MASIGIATRAIITTMKRAISSGESFMIESLREIPRRPQMIKGAKEDLRAVVNRASLDISDALREQEYITDIFYGQQSMIHKERGFVYH